MNGPRVLWAADLSPSSRERARSIESGRLARTCTSHGFGFAGQIASVVVGATPSSIAPDAI
jgi:hypothetical protein